MAFLARHFPPAHQEVNCPVVLTLDHPDLPEACADRIGINNLLLWEGEKQKIFMMVDGLDDDKWSNI